MIEKLKNPIDNSEVTVVSGVISKLNIYQKIDKYQNTHTAQLLIDGAKVNIGGYKSTIDNLTVNNNGSWVEIKEGMSVRIPVVVNGQYLNASRTKIQIVDAEIKAPEAPQNASNARPKQTPSPSGGTQQKAPEGPKSSKTTKVFGEVAEISSGVALINQKDGGSVSVVLGDKASEVNVKDRIAANIDEAGNIVSGYKWYAPLQSNKKPEKVGMQVGHALNGALNLYRKNNATQVFEYAKMVQDATISVKAWYAEYNSQNNLGLDDYDVGAASGHAILNATRDVIDISQASLEHYARELLSGVVQQITNYVKGETNNVTIVQTVPTPVEAVKQEEKKEEVTASYQTAKVEQEFSDVPTEPEIDWDPLGLPMDFSDDLPFAPLFKQCRQMHLAV